MIWPLIYWTKPAREMEGNGSEYVFPSPRSAKDVDTHLDRRAFTRAMKRIMTAVKLRMQRLMT